MMNRPVFRQNRATLIALSVTFLTIDAGCAPSTRVDPSGATTVDSSTKPVSLNTSSDLGDKSPDELLEEVTTAASGFTETESVYRVSGGQFRVKAMRKQLERQLTAYRLIESHEQARQDQKAAAIYGQIELLSQAMDYGWLEYEEPLIELRDRLTTELPGSLEAASADSVVILRTHFEPLEDVNSAKDAIDRHATAFPTHPTGPKLYALLARHLLESNQVPEAKSICSSAAERYTDDELLLPVVGVLRDIRRLEMAQVQQRAVLQARSKEFGGHLDGYFVLFLRPKKLRYMSAVDYVVAQGLQEAIQTADAAEAWELKGWFPASKSGYVQAAEMAEELRKKNTIAIPTFQADS